MDLPRIAIIGAGPAGLSLAKILRDRGYGDIVIYERTTRAGGKVESFAYEGAIHELGACYLTAGYTRLSKWMEEEGFTFQTLDSFMIDDVGKRVTFNEYIYGDAPWKVRFQVLRYLAHLTKFRLKKALGLLSDEDYVELSKPFGPWLLDRNLDVVYRLAKRSTVAMGYGFLDETPLLWGFSWNTPSLFLTGLTEGPRQVEGGWLPYWTKLGDTFSIRYGLEVCQLARTAEGITVTAKSVNGTLDQSNFDHVINTLPFSVIETWPEATPAEQWLGKHSTSTPYASFLCKVSGWFDVPLLVHSKRLDGPLHHRLLAARTAGGTGDIPAFVCYQYAPIDSEKDPVSALYSLLDQLKEDISEEGGTLEEVVARRLWSYFPRYSPEGIANRAPDRLDQIQGIDNVWYSGANVALESIDHLVDFNIILADRIVRRIEGREGWWARLCQVGMELSYHTW